MKVVLFCGGLGTRLREYSTNIPKPMVHIGYRPILWHVMKYYAHYGHKDFILCLGYKADVIKNYFLNYDECASNDFTLQQGGKKIKLVNSDIEDWNITFVDTGLNSNIGQRLQAIEEYLEGEEVFLANYSDGLTDLHLPDIIEDFYRHQKTASFICVKPSQSFHLVSMQENGLVTDIQDVKHAGIRINGGFFVFNKDIFKYMEPGEELVLEPFQRLMKLQQLVAYKYNGFWACMDTFKEQQQLDDMYCQSKAPWAVWKHLERKGKSLEYSPIHHIVNHSMPVSLA
ncbi:MAG: glucose-1-phosphate cytidylyltransferase [Brasilonema octagenarum HA4186-MV1]|uniref:Glucose-1-phosphate cytidylyltransferase n=1 Tax=Brasilonema sennae CENA114 TaxID=415709 RepID=A0A856MN65_9CYAN|nr:glucose-1-phosphate cytidylyltransferase [Brasilonema sennae]MBW4625876.1 glucose-1-phosphate cytidylyltransferase [Brasilonema octagenarum HA4186-MV1]QDL11554.1 glucose-1-phosphate cytidylyltransferase [Brasilonema sennae CENA114]QDL17935.1 glucose-1-phosphate cytidylyltransferase [Brasilonema octagenarum UFV-E1]